MTGEAGPIRVLHVGDEPSFSETVAELLDEEVEQPVVETEPTVADGLDAVSDGDVDCIVSEYEMVDADGLEFLEAVREDNPELPFILFTSDGSEAVAADAISMGVTDYLQKDGGDDQYTTLANRIVNGVSRHPADQRVPGTDERYQALFEHSDEAIALSEFVDDMAVVRDVNPAFEDLFDNPDGFEGRELDDIVASGERREEARGLSQKVQGGQSLNRFVTRETADGTRLLTLQVIPIHAEDEEGASYAFTIYADPTGEQGSDQEQLQVLVEESTDLISVLSEDGTVQYESPSIERILGYDPDELVGENAFEYIHPADRESVIETFQEGVENPDSTPTAEYRFRHADGSWTWLESRGNNQLENPAIEGFVVNSRDISERVAHEQELERVRDRMEFALQSTDAIVWDWNVDENTASFYPSEQELYGTAVDTLEDFIELVHPEDRETVQESNQRALETGEAKHEEVRIVPDGEVRWIDAPGQPKQGDDGTTRMIGVVQDITERKRDKQEIERQNERLETFASVVSHDLRNPLNVAKGRIDLAKVDCDSDHLDHVERALERMTVLIDDLLTLAREGESAVEPEPVELADSIDACWQNVDTRDATLVTETDRTITADRSKLRQLFENLFRNAVEHGDTDVTVTVGELADGFSVEDDGPGIPEDERADVLSPGYTTTERGTGFGLSIVTQVAEVHGWDVSVTEGTDGGARFEITGVDDAEE